MASSDDERRDEPLAEVHTVREPTARERLEAMQLVFYAELLHHAARLTRGDLEKAEELVRAVFLKIVRHIECNATDPKFDSRKLALSYFKQAIKNENHDDGRALQRNRIQTTDPSILASIAAADSDATADAELVNLLKKNIEALGERERIALQLHAQGLTYEQIAARLVVSLSAVKRLVPQALVHLRKLMHKD